MDNHVDILSKCDKKSGLNNHSKYDSIQIRSLWNDKSANCTVHKLTDHILVHPQIVQESNPKAYRTLVSSKYITKKPHMDSEELVKIYTY